MLSLKPLKTALKKTVSQGLADTLAGLGYSEQKKRAAYVKALDRLEIRIACDLNTAGYPKNIIAVNILVFIDLLDVNALGASLFVPPAVNPATLWGNIRLFTPANSAQDTNYYVDLSTHEDTHLEVLIKDITLFDQFASSLVDIRKLSNERLMKTPHLRKNFGTGLTWDYKYGYPQYLSIIHALNHEFDDARLCALHANHLKAAEKEALLAFIATRSDITQAKESTDNNSGQHASALDN
ncbi:hypothetical protein ASF84_23080 [Pseudomonas sp. Leaf127]|uniref:hypothetical protein n=1 Tax=Pseudomonas sp. Leaf127 TaxID=1736267 RepID=UPI0007028FC1|nr:hypothetical protein [Pseudomonas sp. Leaf127]KQQ49195.1 hypothetical protein ASF84_23080 [Pseudomonas sp. Leaf127]